MKLSLEKFKDLDTDTKLENIFDCLQSIKRTSYKIICLLSTFCWMTITVQIQIKPRLCLAYVHIMIEVHIMVF